MVFVANDQPPEVMQPRKQPFDFPTAFVASTFSAILGSRFASIALVGCDQLHATLLRQLLVEWIAVIRLVADDFIRQMFGYTGVKGCLHQHHFMRAGTACVYGERKTFSVAKAHDFGAFTAFGLAHAIAPFFAGAKVPSIKPSFRSMPPRSRRSSAKAVRIVSKTPSCVHGWNRRWQVLRGGYRSGKSFQGAPVRKIHKMPLSTARASWGGRPENPGCDLEAGTKSAIRCHCSSVKSMSHRIGSTKTNTLRFWDRF